MEMIRKASLALLLVASLTFIGQAVAGSLPAKPPYTNPVTVRSADPGMTLDAAIRAAARAAGVQVLTKNLPGVRVSVDFKGVPFRSFLDLLLRIYAPSHDYALLPEGVVLVAPKETLKGFLPAKEERAPAPARGGEARVSAVVPVAPLGEEAVEVAKAVGVAAYYARSAGAVVVTGEAEKVAQAAELLRSLVEQARASLPASPAAPEPPKEETALLRVPEGANLEEAAALAQAVGLKATLLKEARLLLVQGSPEALARFQQALPSLEGPKKEAPPQAITAHLEVPEGVNATEVAQALKVLYPDLAISAVGRVVAVRAAPDHLKEVQALVEKLWGTAPPAPGSQVLSFALPEGVDGAKVAEALKAVYPEAKVAVADRVLLIELSEDKAAEAKGVVEGLLQKLAETWALEGQRAKESPAARHPLRGYPIYGDPGDVAKALQGIFPPDYLRSIGAAIEVLPQQKAVVVAAPYEVHKKVVDLLRAIDPPREGEKDQGKASERAARLELANLSADKAASYLQALEIGVQLVPEPSGRAVWLKGPAAEVDRAAILLKTADANPPQVRVGVRVVQLERSALEQLSSDLSAALGPLALNLSAAGLQGGYSLPAALARSLTLNLSALESKGLAKTLLSTEVVALEGQEAALNSGGTLYVTAPSSSTGGGGGGGGQEAPAQGALTQIDYGLILKVQPQVVPDPLGVNLKVSLELGNLPTGGPVTGSIDIGKRKLEALLRLRDGETGLIGGLLQEEERGQEGGVPILKDIPLIGALFKTSETRRTERVLLIMLTPTVHDYPLAPVRSLPPAPKVEEARPEDPRTPPEPPAEPSRPEGRKGDLPETPESSVALSASDPVRPAVPDFPPPTPIYTGQAYLTDRGAALYVLGDKTTAEARPVAAYLVRKGKNGGFESALRVPFRANRDTFGAGSMAVLTLQTDAESLKAADGVVLVLEDELGKAWSLFFPLTRSR